ncbi:MAG: hypothetical protein JSS43_18010 [Proteobacteria bacterium]|nr:hypothetical protein [Pseudomonadota bacterium]
MPLEACDSVALDADLEGRLDLDSAEYAGGVAVWAALKPIFDTTDRASESGIHVHARHAVDMGKQIDGTYPAVVVHCGGDLFGKRPLLVTRQAAVSYYFSRFMDRQVKHLTCTHCAAVHLDAGRFAIHPHRKHLCQACGRLFHDQERAVSNPVAFIREALGDLDSGRQPVRASQSLDIRQADYPGGIQIWASNPAILWTAPRPEEEGIHVHLYGDRQGPPVIDETFDRVRIDGVPLDNGMVRYLMAQQALPELYGKIEGLTCPHCDDAHFDQGETAFEPHGEHTCEQCGGAFRAPGRRRLLVSNPLLLSLERLRRSAPHLNRVEATR